MTSYKTGTAGHKNGCTHLPSNSFQYGVGGCGQLMQTSLPRFRTRCKNRRQFRLPCHGPHHATSILFAIGPTDAGIYVPHDGLARTFAVSTIYPLAASDSRPSFRKRIKIKALRLQERLKHHALSIVVLTNRTAQRRKPQCFWKWCSLNTAVDRQPQYCIEVLSEFLQYEYPAAVGKVIHDCHYFRCDGDILY